MLTVGPLRALSHDTHGLRRHIPNVVRLDIARYPGWYLFSHPMAFTRVHHDRAGMSTWVRVVRGVKLWFFLRWCKAPGEGDWKRRAKAMRQVAHTALEFATDPPWVEKGGIVPCALRDASQAALPERVAQWHVVVLREGDTM